jgi:hypothetical protein
MALLSRYPLDQDGHIEVPVWWRKKNTPDIGLFIYNPKKGVKAIPAKYISAMVKTGNLKAKISL